MAPSTMKLSWLLLICCCIAVLAGCSLKKNSQANQASITQASASAKTIELNEKLILDMLDATPQCQIEHRGALIDLGTEQAVWFTPTHPNTTHDSPKFERNGATWSRVFDRVQSFTVSTDSVGPALISMRARARASHKATVSIDGKVVGTMRFSQEEDRIVSVHNSQLVLSAGLHSVTIRWAGSAKTEEPVAEVDWIRIGTVDAMASTYAPPIRQDVYRQVEVNNTPRKAYVLRAPSVLRCVALSPSGSTLRADFAGLGTTGSGEIEVRVRSTSSEPAQILERREVNTTSWQRFETFLGRSDTQQTLQMIEIAVTKSPAQGRVAIGEPRIVYANKNQSDFLKQPTFPYSNSAIVLVLAGLKNASLPSLQKLLPESVFFQEHHATSRIASAAMASLVTGVPEIVHTVEDTRARLPERILRLGHFTTHLGIESAMFTEVPTTASAFGFGANWSQFNAYSLFETNASVLEEATKFVRAKSGKKFLLVVHSKGAHPPWDIDAESLKTMLPYEYAGPVDAKNVVSLLHRMRKPNAKPLNEADYTRLNALHEAVLANQDKKLETLIASLRETGELDRTTLFITSDVPFIVPTSASNSASIKKAFVSSDPMHEETTHIPLLIRFKERYGAGKTVTTLTDTTDVTTTILAALNGSQWAKTLAGRDLGEMVSKAPYYDQQARVFNDGRHYQVVWANLKLYGTWGHLPTLVQRDSNDVISTQRPYEFLIMWAFAIENRNRWLSIRAQGPGREPATIDAKTLSALEMWEPSRSK